MPGITRGISTLVGAAAAGFLIWLAAQMSSTSEGGYWATYALVAAAGLAVALSQILGGWTKWGWPRLDAGVFLLAFLPVAIVGLWLLFARQPGDALLNTGDWSDSIGIGGVVSDLGELLAAIAFGMGLTFGLTFDTTGPRRVVAAEEPARPAVEEPPRERVGGDGERAADEPITAERRARIEEGAEQPADERLRRR